MTGKILDDTPRNVDIVRCYLDAERQAFGFVPTSWISDAIRARRVLIAEADDYTHAILMHGTGSDGTLRLLIAYTCPDGRLQELARRLIATAETRAAGTNVTRLQAIVATDLEANGFWQAENFIVTSQRRPSRGVRRLANIYHRDLAQRGQYFAEWEQTLHNKNAIAFLDQMHATEKLFHRYTQKKRRLT